MIANRSYQLSGCIPTLAPSCFNFSDSDSLTFALSFLLHLALQLLPYSPSPEISDTRRASRTTSSCASASHSSPPRLATALFPIPGDSPPTRHFREQAAASAGSLSRSLSQEYNCIHYTCALPAGHFISINTQSPSRSSPSRRDDTSTFDH